MNKMLLPAVFILLSLVIIGPLLAPGYLLVLDAIAVPAKIVWPSFWSASFLYDSLVAILNTFLPSYWIQKLLLLAVFFFSGLGMSWLINAKNTFINLFAGFFYTVNPFVYERVMAGHWEFLLGYAVFPFIVMAAQNLCQSPGLKSAVILAVLTTLSVSFANHWSFILAIFLLLYFPFYLFTHRENSWPLVRSLVLFGAMALFLNLNWLIPTLLGSGTVGETVRQFGREDLITFQSAPDTNFGLIFNLLSGYGFWIEAQKYFISPKDIIFFWPIISMVFILLAVVGVYKTFKDKEKSALPLVITLVIMFFISLDLAGGVALNSFANIAFWFYEKIPFLYGLREPQKLAGIIMFCYAFFGAIGLSFILEKIKPVWKYLVMGIFLILPFIYTPTIFGGFWGQLKPVFYPASWSKINKKLNEDKNDYLTLFFPWHQYMRFGFANNLVLANPAPRFFTKPILSAQNYETKSLYSHDTRPEALHIEGLLSMEKEGINLAGEKVFDRIKWGESTAVIGVKYIILAKESDWETYKFLDKSPDLGKIFEDQLLILYRNLAL